MKLRGRCETDDFRTEVASPMPFPSSITMASRSEKFARKPAETKDAVSVPKEPEEVIKFSPEEEAVSPSYSITKDDAIL